jgi:hypothetical protein
LFKEPTPPHISGEGRLTPSSPPQQSSSQTISTASSQKKPHSPSHKTPKSTQKTKPPASSPQPSPDPAPVQSSPPSVPPRPLHRAASRNTTRRENRTIHHRNQPRLRNVIQGPCGRCDGVFVYGLVLVGLMFPGRRGGFPIERTFCCGVGRGGGGFHGDCNTRQEERREEGL